MSGNEARRGRCGSQPCLGTELETGDSHTGRALQDRVRHAECVAQFPAVWGSETAAQEGGPPRDHVRHPEAAPLATSYSYYRLPVARSLFAVPCSSTWYLP